MNKIKFTILALILPGILIARDIEPAIKIVASYKDLGFSDVEITQAKALKMTLGNKGYVEKYSDDASAYLKMSRYGMAFSEDNEKNPHGSDIKRDLSNIKLTFKFNGIPFVSGENILSYAVAGTYKNGWTGIAEYFKDPNSGSVCHYLIHDVITAKMGIVIVKDIVKDIVNNKVTDIHTEGNYASGYLYSVNWYDAKRFHQLDCANQIYDKSIQNKVIELAKKIDRNYK